MPANSVFQYSPPGEFILSPPRDTVRTFVRAVKTDQKSTIPPNSVLPETLPGEFILSPPIDSVRTIIEPVKADQQSDMDISEIESIIECYSDSSDVAQIPERGYSIIECYPSSSDIAQSPERQSNTPSQTYLRKAAFQNVQATIEHAGAHNTVNIYPTTINIYPSINSYPSVNAPLKPAAPNISKPLSKIPRLKKPTPTSPTPPPVELATCENPYIYKYRVYDLHSERCTLGIGLKFPSPTSALGQQWAQYSNTYFGTKHAVYKNQEVEVVGPFRSAAIWEMVGKTFEKGEREKKMRRKAKNSRGQWSDVDFEMRKSLEGGGGLEELRAMEENEELF